MANNKDYLDNILDDNERVLVKVFYENEAMREGVRKVILAGLYQNGTLQKGKKANPLYNSALALVSNAKEGISNEALGADLRAMWEGLSALETAFSAMSKYQDEPKPETRSNPAR